MQPADRQAHLAACLDKLMADVQRTLEPKNRDKFTQARGPGRAFLILGSADVRCSSLSLQAGPSLSNRGCISVRDSWARLCTGLELVNEHGAFSVAASQPCVCTHATNHAACHQGRSALCIDTPGHAHHQGAPSVHQK